MPFPLPPLGRGPGRFDLKISVAFGRRGWPGPTRKRPPGKGGEPEYETVEPPRPKDLSGGAAAALEFDA